MHMRRGRGHAAFVIPAHQAETIKTALAAGAESDIYQQLFSNGVVYMLPRASFTQESPQTSTDPDRGPETTDHEWNSQERVKPELLCLVSPDLLDKLLVFSGDDQNVEVIDEATMRRRDIELRAGEFADILPPGDELDASALDHLAIDQNDPDAARKIKFLNYAQVQLAEAGRLSRAEFSRRLAELRSGFKD